MQTINKRSYNKLLSFLYESRTFNSILASSVAIVPYSIFRGLIIAVSAIAEIYGHTDTFTLLGKIDSTLLIFIPFLLNIYSSIYWSTKNKLPITQCTSAGLITFLIVSALTNPDISFITETTIPNAFICSIFSNIVLEKSTLYFQRNVKKISLNLANLKFVLLILSWVVFSLLIYLFIFFKTSLLFSYLSHEIYPSDFKHGLYNEIIRDFIWFFGIHAHHLFQQINTDAYLHTKMAFELWHTQGVPLPILSTTFYETWCSCGGSGMSLCLVICLFVKRRKHTALIRSSLPLSLLNINEPLIFGLPIVLNPVLFIPFIIVPALSYCIAYVATALGLVPHISVMVGWSTPPLLNIWLATEGSVGAVLLQFCIILIGVLIYYPFFSKLEKNNCRTESFDAVTPEKLVSHATERFTAKNNTDRLISENQKKESFKEIERLKRSGDFVLFFQPQVNIITNKIVGVEVLLRHKSKKGKITPPYFLQHYENLNMLSDVDFWVLSNTLKHIQENMISFRDLTVSINITPNTLSDNAFKIFISGMVNKSFPEGCFIEFEITENENLSTHAIDIFDELRKNNIRIALDDFGTGYSSISHLNEHNFDKIKLDRALVLQMKTEHGVQFFNKVVELCHVTHEHLVVEGIETKEELLIAQKAGVELVQGYYFHKPMSGSQLNIILLQQNIEKMSAKHP